jgi:vancomycin resistance protein YoaR
MSRWITMLTSFILFNFFPSDTIHGEPKPISAISISSTTISDISAPPFFVLKFGDREWKLNLQDVGFDGIDPTTLDRKSFMRWLQTEVEPSFNQRAYSAHYYNRVLIPHRMGRELNRVQVMEWLDQIHEHLNQPLELPIVWLEPKLRTERLQQLRQKRLSSYATFFNASNRNRSHNIYLSAATIDHQVLMPGEVFSFNQVVGMRSVRKGYLPARVIVHGEYSEGVGGGICQTSSTLFNSVDRAGLQIIERSGHSKKVSYVPRGRDATVSWDGPDFKFRNQFNEPILIAAYATQGRLVIAIYGPMTLTYPPQKGADS